MFYFTPNKFDDGTDSVREGKMKITGNFQLRPESTLYTKTNCMMMVDIMICTRYRPSQQFSAIQNSKCLEQPINTMWLGVARPKLS